jgi:RND family efflux transporter MFP subunit
MSATEIPVERERRSGAAGRWVLLLLVLLAIGGITVAALLPRLKARAAVQAETRDLALPVVAVARPQTAAPEQEIVLPSNIQAFTDAPIYARTSGYLKRWTVDMGARVKSGQLLAEIDTPEVDQQLQQARADLATAEANLRLAQITADRYVGLLKTESVSQQEADNATGSLEAKRATVLSAQHNVKRLEEMQAFQKIYAPFDGVITVRNTDVGALINSGSNGTAKELFHIAATHKLRVYVNVPQTYWPAAKPGLRADLTLPEFPGRRFQGTLVRTADSLDSASRTMLAEVDVDNPTGELKPGAYAEMHLKLPSRGNVFVLPTSALLFRSDGMQIAVVRDGRVVFIPVILGRDFGTKVEISSGLRGDEAIVINPPDSLISGQAVRVVQPEAGGKTQ